MSKCYGEFAMKKRAGQVNDHIKKIEKATQSAEYQTYAAMAGAALAGAILSPDKTTRERGLKQYNELLQKQAAVVRSSVLGKACEY